MKSAPSSAPSDAKSEAAGLSTLVVWDFDWSLVNENSDTWVVKQLGGELTPQFRRLRDDENLGWTEIMNRQMRNLWEKGVSRSEITWSMSRLPVFTKMLEAVFIEEFLKHHGIRSLFGQGIYTNRGLFLDDGRLDVQPFHLERDAPHGCPLCPPNMCKGIILDRLSAAGDGDRERAFDKVIYVGDGGGDYCPSLRLRPGDLLLARDEGADGRRFGLCQRIEKEEGGRPLACRLMRWKDGDGVHAAFEDELKKELKREP